MIFDYNFMVKMHGLSDWIKWDKYIFNNLQCHPAFIRQRQRQTSRLFGGNVGPPIPPFVWLNQGSVAPVPLPPAGLRFGQTFAAIGGIPVWETAIRISIKSSVTSFYLPARQTLPDRHFPDGVVVSRSH